VISREGLRNLTVEGQSASLALLGMMLGIGARGCYGWFFGMEKWKNDKKWRSDPESGVWKENPEAKRLVGWWMNRETWGLWFKHLKWGYYGDVTNMNHWLVV
jgi:hypothetical protein